MATSARSDRMPAVNRVVSAMLVAILAGTAGAALAQNFPNKPLQILTTQVGGGSDFVARVVAQAIAGDLLAKAPPDGHVLLLYANAIWLAPFLQDNVAYDPVRDFAPISLVSRAVNIVVVHPSLPVKSVRDLIVLAQARPGELNYSSGPAGSPNHLGMELFKAMTGVIGILNKQVVQALARPEVKERFLAAGVETVGSSPEQLAATVKSDMARTGKVIREAGIRGE